MSVESVQSFLTAVSEQQELQTQLTAALDAENDRQAVTDLAQASGYDFTPEELWQEVQARQNDIKRRQKAGELSDEELEAVAGGELVMGTAVVAGITYLASVAGSAYGSFKAAQAIKW
ncbi:MAG: Nif11-like leader peptide family natural product precursor [Leptolyngbya sp. SIO1E4]|nr:Nif11-like leader peptide family natural product precursor [Leptolyngbya sp. SIO1E4]